MPLFEFTKSRSIGSAKNSGFLVYFNEMYINQLLNALLR